MATALNRAQKGEEDSGLGALIGIVLVIVFIVVWSIWGESISDAQVSAKGAVEASGFSEVVVSKPVFLGCSDGDTYRFHWQGKNQLGKDVSGFACAGAFFKGWTVRLER